MKKILLAACALVAVPVLAQTPPPMANMAPGAMGARVQLRTDVVARTQRMFAMLDANRDGVLDQAELAAAGKRWDGARGGMGKGGMGKMDGMAGMAGMAGMGGMRMPMDRNAMFDMIDTNHDGSINRDEFARAHDGMGHGGMGHGGMGHAGKGKDRDGDGQPDRARGMGGGMARMMTMADTNRDGRVTLQEATAMALQHFDRLDTNRDGQLTPEERAAGRGR